MMEHFLSTNLFLLTIFLTNVCVNYAYNPPAATVEPLYPQGLRISIPDEYGITLVAFHVKFNEDFDGLEAGHIAKDIRKINNERWTYENNNTELRRDDILYYWIHVVYQGLGYNLIDQSHRVTDFFNYDHTLHIGSAQSSQECTTKSATWIFEKGGRRQPCPRELIFEDNFDNLNSTKWTELKQFGDLPDYEFVVYLTNDTTDTTDGKLRIKPLLLNTKYGTHYATRGQLILEDCTGNINTEECQRQANDWYILPPVISGRINTKGKFEFLFGRIEIRAKLPQGDWVYPLITLESAENTWQLGIHHEIRIASSAGNDELRTPENEIISNRILYAGGLTTSLSESDAQSTNRMTLPKRQAPHPWANDFHLFQIEWKSGLVIVKVDGVQYGEHPVDGSFGKPSFITLGVAVGGVHEFQDHVTSSGYVKPWRNVDAKALYYFYLAKDSWYPTWSPTKTALQVDYVRVWAL